MILRNGFNVSVYFILSEQIDIIRGAPEIRRNFWIGTFCKPDISNNRSKLHSGTQAKT